MYPPSEVFKAGEPDPPTEVTGVPKLDANVGTGPAWSMLMIVQAMREPIVTLVFPVMEPAQLRIEAAVGTPKSVKWIDGGVRPAPVASAAKMVKSGPSIDGEVTRNENVAPLSELVSMGVPDPLEKVGVAKSEEFAKIPPWALLDMIVHATTSPTRIEVVPVTIPRQESVELTVGVPRTTNDAGL